MAMIRVFRVLACLAALSLTFSGGLYTHASEQHAHSSDLSVENADMQHEHAQTEKDTSEKDLSLHCGALSLTLPCEAKVSEPLRKAYIPGHIEPAHRPGELLFDTPPPRLFS